MLSFMQKISYVLRHPAHKPGLYKQNKNNTTNAYKHRSTGKSDSMGTRATNSGIVYLTFELVVHVRIFCFPTFYFRI